MDVYPRDRSCDSASKQKKYHKFNVLFVGKGLVRCRTFIKPIPSDSLEMDEKYVKLLEKTQKTIHDFWYFLRFSC